MFSTLQFSPIKGAKMIHVLHTTIFYRLDNSDVLFKQVLLYFLHSYILYVGYFSLVFYELRLKCCGYETAVSDCAQLQTVVNKLNEIGHSERNIETILSITLLGVPSFLVKSACNVYLAR